MAIKLNSLKAMPRMYNNKRVLVTHCRYTDVCNSIYVMAVRD